MITIIIPEWILLAVAVTWLVSFALNLWLAAEYKMLGLIQTKLSEKISGAQKMISALKGGGTR